VSIALVVVALWAPLLLARRWPVAAAIAVYAVALLQLAAGVEPQLADVAVLVALYLVTVHGPHWAHVTAACATLAGATLAAVLTGLRDGDPVAAGT